MTAPAKPPKHRLRQEGWRTAAPFLLPSMIGMLLFSLLPLLLSALISLTDWNGLDQLLAASLVVAQILSQTRRGVTAFRVLYDIPVLTSWVAASLIWKTVLSPEYGALNNILALFGIDGPGWLLDET